MTPKEHFGDLPECPGQNDELDLTRRGWAWEFLRRNSSYRQDWQRLGAQVAAPVGVVGVRSGSEPVILGRWGVLFR